MRRRDMAERSGLQQNSEPLSSTGDGGGHGGGGSILGSVEELSPSAVNHILMEFMMYFGKAALVFYPVYLTGYLGLSVSWVLLCLMMITWWKKNRQWKDVRIGSAISFVDNEANVICNELKTLHMATWVHFPEVEKVEWLNKVLEKAWPFFGIFMDKLLKEQIEPIVRKSNPALNTFKFTKIHFGHTPLKITGMKVWTDEVDKREVILDMNILYEGDVDIDATVKPPITVGVKGLQFEGRLRVILEPLCGQAPIVGGVTLFFIRRPTLQINWTGMTNLLDTPSCSHLSEGAILDIIAALMVLPNRLCIPLMDQVKVDQLRFPLPRGVVRVHVLEAKDLVAKDTYMLGMVKGKSDPYVVLRVGNNEFKSQTVKENLNPRWDEVYEFVVHEAPGQELEVELYDEDRDKDDFLGRYKLDLGDVRREEEIDRWVPLEDIQHGEVHLKLQWLTLHTDQSLLKEATDSCACAMLSLYLDNASNLPKDRSDFTHNHKPEHGKQSRFTKRAANPSSYVKLTVNKQVQKSQVVFASKDPAWEVGFTFFVHSVKDEQLHVQVLEHEKKTLLGTFTLPLSRLLRASDMTLNEQFPLELSGANSTIKMKAVFRILSLEKPEDLLSPPLQLTPQTLQTNTSSTGPSLSPSFSHSPSLYDTTPQASSQAPAAGDTNGFDREGHHPSLGTDGQGTAPSTPRMRRYDSRSLLSENSIASSRFDLSEGAHYPEAIMSHHGSFGQIQLTVRYATLRNKLIIIVNSCRALFRCSDSGTDAYVRLYLLPDQSWRHRMRTQVKRRTVNPVFNEKFEFNVSLEEAGTRKVDVAVKNNRMFHTRERKEIGMVLIDLSQLDLAKGFTEWYELTLPGLTETNETPEL